MGLRVKGAYAGTVTEEGSLVSDRYILFNQHFVCKAGRETAAALKTQTDGVSQAYTQETARARLNAARSAARHEGHLLGQLTAAPALRVKAEHIAGIRFQERKRGPWRYVWVDAHRLRLLVELFKKPLTFFCAAWDEAVLLKRGKRTVGCIMPASPCRLDIDVHS